MEASQSQQQKMITIGKFIAPHGIKGEIKVYPYSDFLERCALLKEVTLEGQSGSEVRYVREARIYKNLWILRLEGCDSREDAALLTGLLLKIPPDQRIPLPEGSYYFDEIIGLRALDMDMKTIGTVREIIKTSGNDVYVVERTEIGTEEAKEILVPALHSVVKEINTKEGYMLLDLPEGLTD